MSQSDWTVVENIRPTSGPFAHTAGCACRLCLDAARIESERAASTPVVTPNSSMSGSTFKVSGATHTAHSQGFFMRALGKAAPIAIDPGG
jgi:hypothetical protein